MGFWRIIISVQKCKHIFKHSACCTRSRHKFYNIVSFLLVFLPFVFSLLLCICVKNQYTIARSRSRFNTQKGEALPDLFQLMLHLFNSHCTGFNLFFVRFCKHVHKDLV